MDYFIALHFISRQNSKMDAIIDYKKHCQMFVSSRMVKEYVELETRKPDASVDPSFLLKTLLQRPISMGLPTITYGNTAVFDSHEHAEAFLSRHIPACDIDVRTFLMEWGYTPMCVAESDVVPYVEGGVSKIQLRAAPSMELTRLALRNRRE